MHGRAKQKAQNIKMKNQENIGVLGGAPDSLPRRRRGRTRRRLAGLVLKVYRPLLKKDKDGVVDN